MELIKALSKVQQKLKAPKDCYNDFAKFPYRNAEAILEAVKPLLVEHGLVLVMTDDMINLGDRYYLKATTKLLLDKESIEVSSFAREELSLKGQIAAQISGGCSSYARKYALSGLFCIDEGKKDPDSHDNSKNEDETIDLAKTAKECGWTVEQVLNSYDPPVKSLQDIDDKASCAAYLKENMVK